MSTLAAYLSSHWQAFALVAFCALAVGWELYDRRRGK